MVAESKIIVGININSLICFNICHEKSVMFIDLHYICINTVHKSHSHWHHGNSIYTVIDESKYELNYSI